MVGQGNKISSKPTYMGRLESIVKKSVNMYSPINGQ